MGKGAGANCGSGSNLMILAEGALSGVPVWGCMVIGWWPLYLSEEL